MTLTDESEDRDPTPDDDEPSPMQFNHAPKLTICELQKHSGEVECSDASRPRSGAIHLKLDQLSLPSEI